METTPCVHFVKILTLLNWPFFDSFKQWYLDKCRGFSSQIKKENVVDIRFIKSNFVCFDSKLLKLIKKYLLII